MSEMSEQETPQQKQEIKFLRQHLAAFVGGTIVEVGGVLIEDAVYPYLAVRVKNGKEMFILGSCDAEGNAPGFLEIVAEA